jgi:hypothetical protein
MEIFERNKDAEKVKRRRGWNQRTVTGKYGKMMDDKNREHVKSLTPLNSWTLSWHMKMFAWFYSLMSFE